MTKKTKLNLVKSIDVSIDAVLTEMTTQVRVAARNDGWDPESADSLSVIRRPEVNSIQKFTAKAASPQAWDNEFGKETGTPKATVRKFMENSKPWEKLTAKLYERNVFKEGRK